MNIYLSPISSVLTGFILVLGFIHYLVLIEFYYKNKDKLNNPELDNEEEFERIKAYREFRLQKRLYGTMSQEDIDKVNNLSKEHQLQEQKEFDSYYEVRKKEVKK